MKRYLLASLSALALSGVAAPAFANEIAAVQQNSTGNVVAITPFNLVTRSYQGYFTDRGIPSNGAFVKAAQTGRVTATDLVKVAIANGRLNPETLSDQAYLNAVESHLDSLDTGN